MELQRTHIGIIPTFFTTSTEILYTLSLYFFHTLMRFFAVAFFTMYLLRLVEIFGFSITAVFAEVRFHHTFFTTTTIRSH